MKRIFYLIPALLLSVSLSAQDCANPVTATTFQNTFNQVAVQPTNQKKLDMANQFVNANCLTSAQVKQMAQLFNDDAVRLDFCKNAYAHVSDHANFYDVYDAFSTFSYAIRLNDYVRDQKAAASTPATPNVSVHTAPVNNTVTPTGPTYPNWTYPSIATYHGKKGCNGPVISDDAFNTIAQNVFKQPTDESKVVAIEAASDANCLCLSMVMKLSSMITSQPLRMTVMKYAFPKLFDQENYSSGMQVFSNSTDQTNWHNFAKDYLTPAPPSCTATDADVKSIASSMHNKPFDDDKLKVVDAASSSRCYTVAQIKTLSKEMSFSDGKLKLFKQLYSKCSNQSDYYLLADELTFSSEKDDLNNFIRNGGK